jgi:hypothetical protein
MNKIKISEEFSNIPGGRYKKDGANSGEEFREKCLKPKFDSLKEGETLLIDFDGAYGYPTSFLEEAFGGLARLYDPEKVLNKLKFKSNEESGLIEEVIRYIKDVQKVT